VKAYELGELGSVENLRLVERPDPVPGPGEALVRYRANSLNYRDLMIVNGDYGLAEAPERIPVSDGAGEVIAVGEGVAGIAPGDRVMVSFFTGWLDGEFRRHYFGTDLGGGCDGTLTELGVVPASSLVVLPEELSYAQAACLPCAALTAWVLMVEFGRLKAGDTVLLLGTGGVSIFGLQFAVMMGARAVITSSSDDKLARAKNLGAHEGVNYVSDPAWGERVRELTGGADIVVETGGGATLEQSCAAAAYNARIGLIGVLGGVGQKIDPLKVLWKAIHLKGVEVGSRRSLVDMTRAIALNGLEPVIDKRFAFADAPDAYRYLASGAHFGKIVIEHP
jgi:NADPH:quinone reductase-like Zn-dependent oxidoreductase